MTPSSKNETPFERWAGALPAFDSGQEVSDWVRELRDDEESIELDREPSSA